MEVLLASNPVKFISAPEPGQTVADCDAPVRVGVGLIVITALPVRSAPIDVQFASLSAVTVYVFVLLGEVPNVYGLVVMPATGVDVVPSK